MCGNDYHDIVKDITAGVVCEQEMVCFRCGFSDYYAYGHLDSSTFESIIIDHRMTFRLNILGVRL